MRCIYRKCLVCIESISASRLKNYPTADTCGDRTCVEKLNLYHRLLHFDHAKRCGVCNVKISSRTQKKHFGEFRVCKRHACVSKADACAIIHLNIIRREEDQ